MRNFFNFKIVFLTLFVSLLGLIYCQNQPVYTPGSGSNSINLPTPAENIYYKHCLIQFKSDVSDVNAFIESLTSQLHLSYTEPVSIDWAVVGESSDNRVVSSSSSEGVATIELCKAIAQYPQISDVKFETPVLSSLACTPSPAPTYTETIGSWYTGPGSSCEEDCQANRCKDIASDDSLLLSNCQSGCNLTCHPPQNPSPDDLLLQKQWYLGKTNGVTPVGINALSAWQLTRGNPSVLIAIVDNDIRGKALDLQGEGGNTCFEKDWRFVNMYSGIPKNPGQPQHGTAVMETATACTDNHVGIAGIDWFSSVVGVNIDSVSTNVLRGLLWAAGIDICAVSRLSCGSNYHLPPLMKKPADVINFSIAFSDANPAPILQEVLQLIYNKTNAILVASAGNFTRETTHELEFLSQFPDVIAVGATDSGGNLAEFSNWGKEVDILAPGVSIPTLVTQNNAATYLNGTSFASPIVAGTVALMRSVNPTITRSEVNTILKETAQPIGCHAYCDHLRVNGNSIAPSCIASCCDQDGIKNICTAGILDTGKAVQAAVDLAKSKENQ